MDYKVLSKQIKTMPQEALEDLYDDLIARLKQTVRQTVGGEHSVEVLAEVKQICKLQNKILDNMYKG